MLLFYLAKINLFGVVFHDFIVLCYLLLFIFYFLIYPSFIIVLFN